MTYKHFRRYVEELTKGKWAIVIYRERLVIIRTKNQEEVLELDIRYENVFPILLVSVMGKRERGWWGKIHRKLIDLSCTPLEKR